VRQRYKSITSVNCFETTVRYLNYSLQDILMHALILHYNNQNQVPINYNGLRIDFLSF